MKSRPRVVVIRYEPEKHSLAACTVIPGGWWAHPSGEPKWAAGETAKVALDMIRSEHGKGARVVYELNGPSVVRLAQEYRGMLTEFGGIAVGDALVRECGLHSTQSNQVLKYMVETQKGLS